MPPHNQVLAQTQEQLLSKFPRKKKLLSKLQFKQRRQLAACMERISFKKNTYGNKVVLEVTELIGKSEWNQRTTDHMTFNHNLARLDIQVIKNKKIKSLCSNLIDKRLWCSFKELVKHFSDVSLNSHAIFIFIT